MLSLEAPSRPGFRRRQSLWWLVSIGTLLSLLLSACGGGATVAPEAGSIRIGHMGPLTGGAAFLGQEQLNFTRIAVDIFNEDSGLDVAVVEGDTMLSPDEGALVAELMVADESVLAVVGPASSQVCAVVQPIFEEAGLAHVTPSCTNPDLTNPGTETFFRPIPTDDDQAPTAARFIAENLDARAIYLVDDGSSYAVGLSDQVAIELESMGLTDIRRASVTQDDADLTSLALNIVVANSDAVFFPGQIAGQLVNLIVRLREQGWEGTYFLPDGGFDISWVDAAGEAAEGTYVSFFAPDSHDVPAMSDYNARYLAQHGEFGAFGGPSALAARIVLEAIQRCQDADDLSRACVRAEIASTKIEPGILAYPISFDARGQLQGGSFFLYYVEDGDFVLLEP